MDKRIIFAVAGAGKTTYIVDQLSLKKRSLIITYTTANYENLFKKIMVKFNGVWPDNITLMTFFKFLYHFCYKPFLADKIKVKGITYQSNPSRYISSKQEEFYLTSNRYIYSNRLSLLIQITGTTDDVIKRINNYFDELIIDEVQDIAGRDFSFLEDIMKANFSQLYVGDFFQHTFDTSRDGNVNQNLHSDKGNYANRFTSKGFICDESTLINSWRCSPEICSFISSKLGITIGSNRKPNENSKIIYLEDKNQINLIADDPNIIKLHYQKAICFGQDHRNWGDTKGEDHYKNVCVCLNKTSYKAYCANKLANLPNSTKNKLYVALTRAHGNVYIINEKNLT